jgi:hypothetical protein
MRIRNKISTQKMKMRQMNKQREKNLPNDVWGKKRHQIGKKMKTRKKIYKDNNKKNGIDTFWKIIGSDRKHAP